MQVKRDFWEFSPPVTIFLGFIGNIGAQNFQYGFGRRFVISAVCRRKLEVKMAKKTSGCPFTGATTDAPPAIELTS